MYFSRSQPHKLNAIEDNIFSFQEQNILLLEIFILSYSWYDLNITKASNNIKNESWYRKTNICQQQQQ